MSGRTRISVGVREGEKDGVAGTRGRVGFNAVEESLSGMSSLAVADRIGAAASASRPSQDEDRNWTLHACLNGCAGRRPPINHTVNHPQRPRAAMQRPQALIRASGVQNIVESSYKCSSWWAWRMHTV